MQPVEISSALVYIKFLSKARPNYYPSQPVASQCSISLEKRANLRANARRNTDVLLFLSRSFPPAGNTRYIFRRIRHRRSRTFYETRRARRTSRPPLMRIERKFPGAFASLGQDPMARALSVNGGRVVVVVLVVSCIPPRPTCHIPALPPFDPAQTRNIH